MEARGVNADHFGLNRSTFKYTPDLEGAFWQRKYSVGTRWRSDET
ncbi:MAG: hypothetical protein U1B30_07500 [Pseudomonadota bacterium]|nr:hypothetical protein [Pseudomonadota bacterium]